MGARAYIKEGIYMYNHDSSVLVHFSETEKMQNISQRIRQDQLGLEYLEWMEDVYSEEDAFYEIDNVSTFKSQKYN